MKKFDKLVRDKIPEIIETNGDLPHFRIIKDDEEYLQALLQKDVEEGIELANDPNLEELADKLEVIYAITKLRGYTLEQLETARAEKAAKRGGFDKRIFLEYTE